jgi:hypothetical protein
VVGAPFIGCEVGGQAAASGSQITRWLLQEEATGQRRFNGNQRGVDDAHGVAARRGMVTTVWEQKVRDEGSWAEWPSCKKEWVEINNGLQKTFSDFKTMNWI